MVDALNRQGALDNTVIVVTSDHGYFYGEHGLNEERRLAYEETIRIPLLLRYPAVASAGTTPTPMALSIDLAPTLVELAGLRPTPGMQGRSLLPLLRGETPGDWRSSLLVEYYSDTVFPRIRNMGYVAARTDRYKLIHYLELDGMDELYDLESDPFEARNLIADPNASQSLGAMRGELDRLLRATGREISQ